MSLKLHRKISAFTGLNKLDIDSIINTAPLSYKLFYIPKKSGGKRQIAQPNRETKAVQYALIETFFYSLDASSIATAYVKKSSPLVKNVNPHVSFDYTLKTDFKNFFPSIKPQDFFLQLTSTFNLTPDDEDLRVLRNSCFSKHLGYYALSIGAPSSPVISNLTMTELDLRLLSIAKKIDPRSVITRYADDLAFSTNIKGACAKFYTELNALLKKTKSPKLLINPKKTLFLSRKTNKTLTGLVITPQKKISIGRKKKRYIKSLVFKAKKDLLDKEEFNHLRGLLGFVNDVEPEFLNRIITKYGREVLDIIKSN